jgi:fucose permease
VLVSFNAGTLIKVRSLYAFLLVSLIVRFIAFTGIALFPTWQITILLIFVMSLGGAGIDSGLNIFISERGNVRQINWLHASFGLGATVGPFLAAGVQTFGGNWKWDFAAIAFLVGFAAVLIWLTASSWQISQPENKLASSSKVSFKLIDTLRLPVVWISVALFFLYTAPEISAGQWSFSLFTLGRGTPDLAAKFWVGIYWGVFTAGRILFGLFASKVSINGFLRGALLITTAGAAFLLWNPGGYGYVGLVVMGLAQAPIYPSLIAATVSRVGLEHAPNAIGFQSAAGGIGGTSMSSLIGVLAAGSGFEMIAVSVLVLSCLTFIAHEILLFTSRDR